MFCEIRAAKVNTIGTNVIDNNEQAYLRHLHNANHGRILTQSAQ